jgi:hypothetical protein
MSELMPGKIIISENMDYFLNENNKETPVNIVHQDDRDVKSSNLKHVAFVLYTIESVTELELDNTGSMLDITFHGGGKYRYYNVSLQVYENLINAPSIGKYFNAKIKPVYDWSRL